MLKNFTIVAFAAASLFFASSAHGQANPTATRLSHVQIGGGYSYARTDYGQRGDRGLTVFADYDFGLHFGVEADYHYTSIYTPNNVSENSFTIGPRFILRKRKFKFYGKGMIGLGHITTPITTVNLNYSNETDFLFAGGGGVDYLLGRHITIRPVDVEYQRWSFKTGLTPLVLTTGAAYRF